MRLQLSDVSAALAAAHPTNEKNMTVFMYFNVLSAVAVARWFGYTIVAISFVHK